MNNQSDRSKDHIRMVGWARLLLDRIKKAKLLNRYFDGDIEPVQELSFQITAGDARMSPDEILKYNAAFHAMVLSQFSRQVEGKNVCLPYLEGVDWDLLRQQKNHLVTVLNESNDQADIRLTSDQRDGLDGILNLLDFIQDRAADMMGEVVVFGKAKKE